MSSAGGRMFRRVLVGFDGSPGAERAVRAGLEIGAEVVAVSVIPKRQVETEEDERAAFQSEAQPLKAQAELFRGEAEELGVAYRFEAIAGWHPAEMLAELVEERGFDLLVVGRHGRQRATHPGMGRETRQLVEQTSFPLLVVGNSS